MLGNSCWLALAVQAGLLDDAVAQEKPEPAAAGEARQTQGEDLIVYGRALQQIGVAQSASEGVVGYRDFENKPISRVGELAENVPA
jgi:hypothetical protein